MELQPRQKICGSTWAWRSRAAQTKVLSSPYLPMQSGNSREQLMFQFGAMAYRFWPNAHMHIVVRAEAHYLQRVQKETLL